MSTDEDECVECGRSRAMHHEFVSAEDCRPIDCRCDPKDWAQPLEIPKVCSLYLEGEHRVCMTCEHLPECHQ